MRLAADVQSKWCQFNLMQIELEENKLKSPSWIFYFSIWLWYFKYGGVVRCQSRKYLLQLQLRKLNSMFSQGYKKYETSSWWCWIIDNLMHYWVCIYDVERWIATMGYFFGDGSMVATRHASSQIFERIWTGQD